MDTARDLAGLPAAIRAPDPAPSLDRADLLGHDAPAITLARAADLARDLYGITGDIQPLTAEKDANFRIRTPGGDAALLKITNAAEDRGVTDMQTAALIHLAAVAPDLPVQRVLSSLSGRSSEIVTQDGHPHVVRLLSYLDGTILAGAAADPALYRRMGAFQARLTLALRGFFHPSAGHVLQWDIKQAGGLRPMLDAVADTALHARLTALLDRFDTDIAPRLATLRAQVVHNDFNPHNLLADGPKATQIIGLIDFGDMVHTPIACDLAVACSYHAGTGDTPLGHVAQMIAGYHAELPLEQAELDLLPDLMRLRHATTLTVAAWRARRYPANADYILRNTAASLQGLDVLDRMGPGAVHDALRAPLRE